jgi:MFS family permease
MRVDTRPLRRRDFRNLWVGQAISTIGGEIGIVAVPYQVYTLTHSTALVGLLGLASLIPLLVVPLVGGAIADALDRRAVLLRTVSRPRCGRRCSSWRLPALPTSSAPCCAARC